MLPSGTQTQPQDRVLGRITHFSYHLQLPLLSNLLPVEKAIGIGVIGELYLFRDQNDRMAKLYKYDMWLLWFHQLARNAPFTICRCPLDEVP